jgi:hypothetical protein
MENRHKKSIPAKELEEIRGKFDELKVLIQPYLVTLTPNERRELPKMGEKTLSFVVKAHEFAIQNPDLRPPFLDMEEYAIDYSDAQGLWGVRNLAQQLYENIDDIEMSAGSEAYQASLSFYNYVKLAAAQDVPGAKTVYNELKKRFPPTRQKSKDEIADTESDTI